MSQEKQLRSRPHGEQALPLTIEYVERERMQTMKVEKSAFDSALSKLLATSATPKKTISPKKPKTARPKSQARPDSKSTPRT